MTGKIKLNLPAKKTKPPNVSRADIEDAVHSLMGGIIVGKAEGYRVPEFRASSFPYCPVLMAIANPYGEAEYRSDFYFDTGTAIHTILQRWAGRAKYDPKLWGCWRCSGCERFKNDEALQKDRPPGFKPKIGCAKCAKTATDAEWEYVEVTIKWLGLGGHVDTVLEILPGCFIVVDYKTTLFRSGGSGADRAKFPYGQNKVQIQIYCALLKELFGINIVGWALVYIDRKQPLRGPRDYHVSIGEWNAVEHDSMMKVLRWANRVNIPARNILQGRLEGVEPTFEEMDDVVATRPCKSMKQWKSWMQPKFKWEAEQMNGEGVCPHLRTCLGKDEDAIVDYFLDLAEPIE